MTHNENQETESRSMNENVNHRLEFGEYGFLKFHTGPRYEVGVNGLFIAEDVLPALRDHLKAVNKVLPSRETSLAITKLEECIMWLIERRNLREQQSVLGSYKPHISE